MNSFALWAEGENWGESTREIEEVHINIWYDRQDSGNKYIEFGVKMDPPFPDNLYVYLPYDAREDTFQDLSYKFEGNEALVEAMFNASAKVDGNIATLNEGRVIKFISCKDNFEFDKTASDRPISSFGTIIKIAVDRGGESPSERGETVSGYLRFRINKVEKMDMTMDSNLPILEGIMKKTIFIEFNLNNIRKLPEEVIERLSSRFKKLHFFVMLDNRIDLYFFNRDMHDVRVLENHVWDDYIRPEESDDDQKRREDIEKIVAYHWKESGKENEIRDFNLFMKAKDTGISAMIVFRMIIILISLGAFGSLVAEGAEHLVSAGMMAWPLFMGIVGSGLLIIIL